MVRFFDIRHAIGESEYLLDLLAIKVGNLPRDSGSAIHCLMTVLT